IRGMAMNRTFLFFLALLLQLSALAENPSRPFQGLVGSSLQHLVFNALFGGPESVEPPSGQSVSITGVVADTAGNPIAGAEISGAAVVPHHSHTQVDATTTDAGGNYRLTGFPAYGQMQVVAAAKGFHRAEV